MDVTLADQAVAFREATRAAWNKAAAGWDAKTPQIHAWLEEATARLIAASGTAPGGRVLDLAAGAGDQTLAVARAVGPSGSVLATDLSEAILQLALARARQAGCSQVEILATGIEELDLESGSFSAAVCRLGLMFCRDVPLALAKVHRILRPGARFAALVFSAPEHNPVFALTMRTALQHAGLPPRDPFEPGALLSLGKPGLLEALLLGAGFQRVTVEALAVPFRLPSAGAYLDFLRTSAAPVQQILSGLPPEAQRAAWADLEHRLEIFRTPDGWEGPNELLLASGAR